MYYNFDMEPIPRHGRARNQCVLQGPEREIFHTYSAYGRGTETTINTYNYLDLVPKGRDEDALPFTMSWLRHHDRYLDGHFADADSRIGRRTLCPKAEERSKCTADLSGEAAVLRERQRKAADLPKRSASASPDTMGFYKFMNDGQAEGANFSAGCGTIP